MSVLDAYPTFEQFRPLSDKVPMLVGADVYALQTGLTAAGFPCGPADGHLGPATGKQIWGFQTAQKLVKDGIAGPATNNRLIELLVAPQNSRWKLPAGLLYGHVAHESSLYPGRVSPRRDDGSYDAGVAQRNTAHTPASEGFNTPLSLSALATNERQAYDKFAGVPGRRRWLLAAGHWNAPAYACWLAKQEGATGVKTAETTQPGPTARAKLEAYMISATVLMA